MERFMFRQVGIFELSFFRSTSWMHRRPFGGRHLVYNSGLLQVIKSFRVDRLGWLRMLACIAGALVTMPFNMLVENFAVLRGIWGNKHKFYVVAKLTTQTNPIEPV